MAEVSYDVVIPTVGRDALAATLEALGAAAGPPPDAVWVVNDRPHETIDHLLAGDLPVKVLEGRGRGPAAARNVGWRDSSADWIAFLDDDVVPDADWRDRLVEDLAGAGPAVGGVQGRLRVPLPRHRRPTDWERNVAALAGGRWVTADMAYRRDVLDEVGGFDERFPRAYREDADLALRIRRAGFRLEVGRRTSAHPVRPANALTPVRLQAGNADDVLMRALHGPGWRAAAEAPRGSLGIHVATTAAAALCVAALLTGRRRIAIAGLSVGLSLAGGFAWRRVAPGPRNAGEIWRILVTSALIPPAATFHSLRGWAGLPRRLRRPGPRPRPLAVLLDRDGTIVENIPYNADPDLVRPVPGAREALDRLRAAGIATAVVSNQSGVGRGLITEAQLDAVNRRVEELVGPVGPWLVCVHAPEAACDCRKPAPRLVIEAARSLGVSPARCVLIGDTVSDMDAASSAGARAILVPNEATRPEEIHAAPEVAADIGRAVDLVIGARP